MTSSREFRYPGESDAYRTARDRLLAAEIEHRRRTEELAAMRRSLPAGGLVPEDYAFTDVKGGSVRLSELFENGKDILLLYSFMYAPDGQPCPMCSAFLDGLEGNVPHLKQHINLAIVAKAPPMILNAYAADRDWRNLRLISSGDNSYNRDYHGEDDLGRQTPMMNIFQKNEGEIRHTYGTELFFTAPEPDQNPRHVDSMWTLWNVLDHTPAGRPADWWPRIHYEA